MRITIFGPSRAMARSTAANFGLRETIRSMRLRRTVRARTNAIVAVSVAPIVTTMLPPTNPKSAPAPIVRTDAGTTSPKTAYPSV